MKRHFFHKTLKISLLSGLMVTGQSALATIMFFEGESAAIDNKVHAYSDDVTPATGLSVYGTTDAENALVRFTGNTDISVTGGSGYAQISDADDIVDWDSLTIELADGAGFSGLEFALQFLNADVSQQNPGTLAITVNYDGGTAMETYADFSNPANRSFYLYGDAGEVIRSVVLSSAPDHLFQLKQTDISLATPAPVPEPTTWVLLVAGFAAVGTAMRRRRGSIAFS